MVKTIVANEKLDCEHLLGQFLNESHYDYVIDEDCNFFGVPTCGIEEIGSCVSKDCSNCPKGIDEESVIFILRKNFFSDDEQKNALEGLKGAAKISFNRGLAAGPKGETDPDREWITPLQREILKQFSSPNSNLFGEDPVDQIYKKYENIDMLSDFRGYAWISSKMKKDEFEFDRWVNETKKLPPEEQKKEAERVEKEYMSKTDYAASSVSGVAGWYGRYDRIPYGRATAYTEQNFDKFKLAFPLLQKLSKAFSELLPKRWAFQKSCIEKIDPEFHVPDTVFTTITVNRSFQTAAHRDSGDLHKGFSNLTVLNDGKNYSGGLLVLPEYRVAINIRPSDLLLINNHGGIHGNTPIILDEGAERYSVVCYFRENMLNLGEKVYEDCRHNFIEERRLNKDHPLWKPMWNGVSPGWYKSEEWYEYVEKNLGYDMLLKYHPESVQKTFSMDEFF